MVMRLENEAEINSIESGTDSSIKGLPFSPFHQILTKLIIPFVTPFKGLDLNLFSL